MYRIFSLISTVVALVSFSAVLVPGARGATYYVSNSTGSDTNPGSLTSPWRTLAKVSVVRFGAGDQILLRRGDTWREALNLTSSGSTGAPILIGSYGTGANAKILGSDSLAGTGNWAAAGPSLWFRTLGSWDPKALFHDGIGAPKRTSLGALNADWDWYFEAQTQRVYIRLGTNPGQFTLEATRRLGIGWAWVNHVTVRDLEIAYAEFGVGLYGATNWTIDGLLIHDIAVDAIHGNGGAKQNTVQNCTIREWNWHGHKVAAGSSEAYMGYGIHIMNTQSIGDDGWVIQGDQLILTSVESGVDTTAVAIDAGGYASLIANNRITGQPRTQMGGVMVWRPQARGPIQVTGNRIENVGAIGIVVQELNTFNYTNIVSIDHNIILNSCGTDTPDQEALRLWTSDNTLVTVRNNLVAGTVRGLYPHHGIRTRGSRALLVENTIWGADIGISIERSSNDVTVYNNISSGNRLAAAHVDGSSSWMEHHNTLNGAVIGWKIDPSSVSLDPQFVNATGADFHLSRSSPAIGRGAPAFPASSDLSGVLRPIANSWDPGAYAYKPVIQVSLMPVSTTASPGDPVQLFVTVAGAPLTSVYWSIAPTIGSISQTGVYIAPSDLSVAQQVTVTATSTSDPSAFGTATIIAQPRVTPTVGSFESASLLGWEDYGGINVTTDSAYAGKYGAKMSSSGRIDQRLTTTPGIHYEVSALIRINREVITPSWGGIRIQVVDANWSELGSSGYLTSRTTSIGTWNRVTFSFVARSTNSRLVFHNFSNGQFDVSADDFTIDKIP